MSLITGYGFTLPKAQTLSRMADGEATRTRKGPSTAFGSPIGSGAQLVQLWWPDGSEIGDLVSPNADGYHKGRLIFFGDGEDYIGADCWIGYIDWEDNDLGQVVGEQGRYFIGVPEGNVTSGGVEKPAYLVAAGEMTFIGKADSGISKGSSGTVSLYHRSTEVDSGINLTAKALGAAITAAKWVTVSRVRGGQIYVGCWES